MRAFRPSHLQQVARCEARWLLSPDDSAPTAAMLFGTAVHAVLEQWYRVGKDAPAAAADQLGDTPRGVELAKLGWQAPPARCALAGLPHLPKRGACESIFPEQAACIPGSPPIQGTRDLLALLSRSEQRRLGVRQPWLVVDYKTSADPAQWARPAWDLRTDPQGVVYPYAAMLDHGLDSISCRWLYLPSRAPFSEPFPVDFTQSRGAKLEACVQGLRDRGKRMLEILREPTLARRNPDDCWSYNKLCPHHVDAGGPCNPKDESMAESMAERIRRLRGEQAQAATEPEAETEAPVEAEPPKRKRGRPKKSEAKSAPASASASVSNEPAPEADAPSEKLVIKLSIPEIVITLE